MGKSAHSYDDQNQYLAEFISVNDKADMPP